MSRIAQQIGRHVQLYHRQIVFPVAKNHWVLVEMTPHPEALIKVRLMQKLIINQCGDIVSCKPFELCHEYTGAEIYT